MPRASTRLALIAALAAAAPRLASAQATGAERLPLSMRARPLTLTAGTIAVDGSLALHHELVADGTLTAALALGTAWSPTDDVELSATALPLMLSPRLGYGVGTAGGFASDAALGIRWRLVRRVVQAGFGLRATFRGGRDEVFGIEASVPMQLGFSRGRVDLEVGARLALGAAVQSALWARARLVLQVAPQFALVASSGVVLNDLGADARIPAALGGVYTVATARGAPSVDVTIAVEFDRLYDVTSATARTDVYTVSGAMRFFVR